ncbi:hypothetical protein ADIWIN_3783 [Winogradskyella psychrotolerans RS-3]|uniref:Uncharacterized protein n=1 Tax=Winogradskyella psychrotolerans RS-3 TaxID=641526 RepID=S7VLU9_9FLAO|nr:hypothetical protein [Winogradskyella psychrotolerans]EPR70427.1 hypothetical protein ADIWIN_3783 [Winogradskyella psychrotolerans RS-3]
MNFIKKLFGIKKNEEEEYSGNFIVATLNDKVMPIDRGEIYEDPLDEFLQSKGIGEVTGGGTMQLKSGELEYCDVEIQLNSDEIDENQIKAIIEKLEELGAPKGSKLTIEKTEQKIEFGKKEGLGIYLDGINLSDEVYKSSDSEALAVEIRRLAGIEDNTLRYWQANTETGLYFYGDSFEHIKNSINDFVSSHPECENCRIEQIA